MYRYHFDKRLPKPSARPEKRNPAEPLTSWVQGRTLRDALTRTRLAYESYNPTTVV